MEPDYNFVLPKSNSDERIVQSASEGTLVIVGAEPAPGQIGDILKRGLCPSKT